MGLHAVLQAEQLLHRAGQGPPDVHNVQHLQRTGLEVNKILMVAAQRRGTHVVAAHVEDNGVPIQNECGRHLGREGERFDTGAGKVRGHQAYLLLLHQLAALGQTEVGVDHIQVQQLRSVAAGGRLHGEVQSQLALAAAIVADKDFYVLHGMRLLLVL